MPTPIFICGAECGIAVTGTASAGTEHWASLVGTPTVDTTTVNNKVQGGIRSFRFNYTANGTGWLLQHAFATAVASPATVVARFYINFASLPTGDNQRLFYFQDSVNTNGGALFKPADSKIYAFHGSTIGATGVTVTTDTWYRIDMKVVYNTTCTADVQVDGAACGQASVAGTARTCTRFNIGGVPDGGVSSTIDHYIDDIIVSGTSGDYPIGRGGVVGLFPVSDGTHGFSIAGSFVYEAAGANVATNATDTWTHLQNPLTTTVGNFMNDAIGTTSAYLRWNMADLPANASTVNGVAVVTTNHAASATANAVDVLVIDSSATSGTTVVTEIAHLGSWGTTSFGTGVDLSESTVTIPYSCAATGASTGAWTVANVNDLGVIFGATDVNPDDYLDGVCLECDIVASVPAPRRPPVAVLQAVNRSAVI